MFLSHDLAIDSSKELLADPYRFISERCRNFGTDIFEARILLKPTYCMTGPDMAALFYDSLRFKREGAAPEALAATLFGKGGVQQLDGATHEVRKAMFMSLMAQQRIDALVQAFVAALEQDLVRWAEAGQVALYDALHPLLTRVVCEWSGVALRPEDLALRSEQLVAIFDSAATDLKGHVYARRCRRHAERWLSEVIRQVREGQSPAPEQSALHAVAFHVDADGQHLDEHTAAVELLNVLRPTVAVSVYIAFVAHALQIHPAAREALATGELAYTDNFVAEVRRFYPFFPAVAAKVREDFEWQGIGFPEGRRVLLDLYGTNHDPRVWQQPELFNPQRFNAAVITPYNFIPQGGGDAAADHRCPGEAITIALMRAAAQFFAQRLNYRLPPESLQLNMSRMPPIPPNRMLIEVRQLSCGVDPPQR
jgi:fatty-acid peroxygenase